MLIHLYMYIYIYLFIDTYILIYRYSLLAFPTGYSLFCARLHHSGPTFQGPSAGGATSPPFREAAMLVPPPSYQPQGPPGIHYVLTVYVYIYIYIHICSSYA